MENFTHYPLLVFAVSFITLRVSARLGRHFRSRQRVPEKELFEDFNIILPATLTLLGLIIGFSFSMAATRYDLRKNYEEAEANAIGTEYARADLLPAAEATKVRALLRSYLDQRIAFYLTRDGQERHQVIARTTALQGELWSTVLVPAKAEPTPITALAVSGMNDVLNSQGYAQAGFWNRIPTAAWALMGAIAIACNLLLGYGARSVTVGSRLFQILPLLVSIAFMFIADIDAPRHGIILVKPQNLISLAESLKQSPPATSPAKN
ncbi:MAG: hypothetical protein JWR19_1628 [Pedosphaera sp.]|nr:hypothetical protein [Pedosphaera sp.]